jgi:hypothetical protein
MANKTINQLTASGALVSTDELEKQVTGGGQSQKLTLAQMLTFIQNNATAFTQATVSFSLAITAGGANFTVLPAGTVQLAGGKLVLSATDGSASFGSGKTILNADGSAIFASTVAVNGPSAPYDPLDVQAMVDGRFKVMANTRDGVGCFFASVNDNNTLNEPMEFRASTIFLNSATAQTIRFGHENDVPILVIDTTTGIATFNNLAIDSTSGNLTTLGDIEVTNNAAGLILKSPNGTRYRIVVDNAGNLGTVAA